MVIPYMPRLETVKEPPEMSSLASLPVCAFQPARQWRWRFQPADLLSRCRRWRVEAIVGGDRDRDMRRTELVDSSPTDSH
ncbi:MAG: hypothetical protein CM15mP74_35740 [Halieaceae bacterium]|nr:MAG: hypothetical protein CM15mP74_35740 [Halieaceae bacterium]